MNAKGFEQIAMKNFDPTSTAASVTNDTSIRIMLVIMLLADLRAKIHDVKGAFSKRKFEETAKNFMEVPQGMEHHYWGSAVLRLLLSIYRLKQAVLLFWQRLLEIMKNIGHKRSIADPCMYFSRNKAGG